MSGGVSYDITRGMRDVILGRCRLAWSSPPVPPRYSKGCGRATLDNVAADRLIVRLPDDSAGDVQSFQEAIAAVEWRDPVRGCECRSWAEVLGGSAFELAVQTLGARIGDMEKGGFGSFRGKTARKGRLICGGDWGAVRD